MGVAGIAIASESTNAEMPEVDRLDLEWAAVLASATYSQHG
jgi:hypothetical protein